jgi:hypothetical protein
VSPCRSSTHLQEEAYVPENPDKNADELANYGDAVVLPLASSLEEVEASL